MTRSDTSLLITGPERELTAVTGEITLLTGKVGSGKSLWLQRLAGVAPMPADVQCRLAGHAWPDPKSSLAVRLLPDLQPPIFLGQTVAEELAFGLRDEPAAATMAAVLATWGLQDLALDNELRQLNRLQGLRLSLAAMELAAPKLVLLDNPVASLPLEEAARLGEEIRAWAARSALVVVVACNRWQDWQPWAGQTWRLESTDALPAAEETSG